MATAVEQPLTRSELREELDTRLKHYATKSDLAELRADIYKVSVQLGLFITGVVGVGVAFLKLTS